MSHSTDFISTNANLMDVAGKPPPTAEDEARLNAALDTIFNHTPAGNTQMSDVTKEQLDQVVDQSAVAAEELLRQDGWAIVRALHIATAAAINATQVVVLPIAGNLNDILEKVSDPEGFDKAFSTVQGDILSVITKMEELLPKFSGKTGTPTPADQVLLGQLALEYSRLQNMADSAIQPLLFKLISEMQTAGIDTVYFAGN